MTFDEWYAAQYDVWWKDREEQLRAAWVGLERVGASNEVIAGAFSIVLEAVAAQYGD